MTSRREWLLGAAGLAASEPPVEWVCPMDPEVRSSKPGLCPRCGMAMVVEVLPFVEWPMRLAVEPEGWRARQRIRLRLEVLDPKTGRRARRLLVMHEKLFHLFLISGDLSYFAHEHPEPQGDGTFVLETTLPRRGFYRLAGDYYPEGGMPQMAVETIISRGAEQADFEAPRLRADLAPKQAGNLRVALRVDPAAPVAGLKTSLFFELSPAAGLERYLGAWGHLLAASADLIDVIHTHPVTADGGSRVLFSIGFPRPGLYRCWAQFQRTGRVNTAVFTVPVRPLSTGPR